MSSASVTGVVTLPVKTVQVVADMVQGKPRDTTSPVSVVGASVAAGEVATVSDVTVGDRVAWFVSLLASVNVFLAIFNVFPVPPLDGGHIAGALFEAARRGIARLAGRPDPGPADTAKMLPASYLVGGILLIAGIVLIVADIISPVKIF